MRVTINYPGEPAAGLGSAIQVIILEGVTNFDDYPEQRRDVRMQIQHIASMVWDTPAAKNIFFEDECGLCQKQLVRMTVKDSKEHVLVCPVHGTER